jgi:hypothetical protein
LSKEEKLFYSPEIRVWVRLYLKQQGVGGEADARKKVEYIHQKIKVWGRLYLKHQGVGGDANVEGVGFRPALSLELALFHGAVIGQQLEGGAPFLQLHLPVEHHGGGHDNQVRTPYTPARGRLRDAVIETSEGRGL